MTYYNLKKSCQVLYFLLTIVAQIIFHSTNSWGNPVQTGGTTTNIVIEWSPPEADFIQFTLSDAGTSNVLVELRDRKEAKRSQILAIERGFRHIFELAETAIQEASLTYPNDTIDFASDLTYRLGINLNYGDIKKSFSIIADISQITTIIKNRPSLKQIIELISKDRAKGYQIWVDPQVRKPAALALPQDWETRTPPTGEEINNWANQYNSKNPMTNSVPNKAK